MKKKKDRKAIRYKKNNWKLPEIQEQIEIQEQKIAKVRAKTNKPIRKRQLAKFTNISVPSIRVPKIEMPKLDTSSLRGKWKGFYKGIKHFMPNIDTYIQKSGMSAEEFLEKLYNLNTNVRSYFYRPEEELSDDPYLTAAEKKQELLYEQEDIVERLIGNINLII